MKKVKLNLILILGTICYLALILIPVHVWASCSNCTTSSASCTSGTTVAQVNTCLGSLPDGGTVNFSAGSYTWNGEIKLRNGYGVSLIGAGSATTNVNIANGTISLTGATVDKPYRISGFRFYGATPILIWMYPSHGYSLTGFRIDHNIFDSLDPGGALSSFAMLFGSSGGYGGSMTGLIDNNTFTGNDNFMGAKFLGAGDSTTWPSSPKGTSSNFFMEDNIFSFTGVTNLSLGCIDIWNSTSLVFRHNTITNCLTTSHGTIHGGGPYSIEFYNNSLTRTASSGGWETGTRLFHHQGSGEFISFNNTFTGVGTKASNAMGMTHYRSYLPEDSALGYPAGTWVRCDGNNTNTGLYKDGNTSPKGTYYGYPCWHQPGRTGNGATGAGTLSPMYIWNNKWSDTNAKVDMVVEDVGATTPPAASTHIVANRDYYNAVSASAQSNATTPFNGTTGMGFGTLANRPTTCTTNSLESGGGVGYFATDQGAQGTLYRCSATNTWTVQYMPYTYPHPLQGGGGGVTTMPAPGNLRTVQ